MNNLSRIDLNLLVTLHALLHEKHVTRAAIRLNKSQPAVSHALNNLRKFFDDPLLVRKGNQHELTPRAKELFNMLGATLLQLENIIPRRDFNPIETEKEFRISMSDYAANYILSDMTQRLYLQAPGIKLSVLSLSRNDMQKQLIDGEIDFGLGVLPTINEQLEHTVLFTDQFVSVADASTLPERGELDLENWLKRSHIQIATHHSDDGEVERGLAAINRSRNIRFTLPYWTIGSNLLLDTDMLLTVISSTFKKMPLHPNLKVFHPPFYIPDTEFILAWHSRNNLNHAHAWLRRLIYDVSKNSLDNHSITS